MEILGEQILPKHAPVSVSALNFFLDLHNLNHSFLLQQTITQGLALSHANVCHVIT